MSKTLYLIDGYAQIFRAYFAIRGGMRSSVTGEPTHALFGFAGMLIKLLGTLSCEYAMVAIDAPGATFRDDMYAQYKATRNETPDDLKAQIPRVLEMIELFGIPTVAVPGLEADDIIATVVTRVLADPSLADMEIRIVSKDKDLEQLLTDRVSMYDIHTETLTDVAALWANKGVTPDQVIDLLALTGDTVDNVPGIDGIGPKTAAQLIAEFGGIDGILANLDKIKGKKRENIEAGMHRLELSRKLVTLRRDGDFEFDLERAKIPCVEPARLVPMFQQLGFNRYQADVYRLAGEPTPPIETSPNVLVIPDPFAEPSTLTGSLFEAAAAIPARTLSTTFTIATTSAELAALVEKLVAAPLVAIDALTTGYGRTVKLLGLSFAWTIGEAVYVPLDHGAGALPVIGALSQILESPTVAKCGHNVKNIARALLTIGVRLRGVVFDSNLVSTLIDPSKPAHNVSDLAQEVLGIAMSAVPIGDDDSLGVAGVSLDRQAAYSAEQADIALQLCAKLQPVVAEMQFASLVEACEAPLAAVLAEMEANGILCDPDELLRQGDGLKLRVDELREEVKRVSGIDFHLDSPKQLADVLFVQLGFKAGKKTKTGASTDIAELERLVALEDVADPKTSIPRLIIEYRMLTKLIGTYLGNLRSSVDAETGRIHTTFHQIYTATGRLASQGPNLQNIPVRTDVGRLIRKAFHAPTGHSLICADYSQVELRILAHLSGDQGLIDAFAQDLDIHTAVAAQVFGVPLDDVTREMRGQAKTINFGIIYGISAFGLARRIGGLDVGAATTLIEGYREQFPGIDRFLQRCIQDAMDNGYVTTLLGRRRMIPEVQSPVAKIRSLGERLAINSVVQGSAADLIKLAMVNVQHRIDRDYLPLKLLLQIHDELVLETPTDLAQTHAAIVLEEMESAMTLRVPLRCSAGIGTDWLSAK